MTHINTINKKISSLQFPLYSIAICLFMFLGFYAILQYSTFKSITPWAVAAIFFLIVALVIIANFMKSKKPKPEKLFLIIAIPSCLAFCLFLLPNQVPDEIWHIYRVLDIFNDGNSLMAPQELLIPNLPENYKDYLSALQQTVDYSQVYSINREFDTYSLILYLIPGLFCSIGNMLHVNPFILIIVARIVNAGLFIAAGYWVIKKVPFGKSIALIYLLNPMLIQQESSCSADVLTNSFCLLFIATILAVYFKPKATKIDIFILVGLFLCVCLAKYAYAPLGILFFLFLPRVKNKRIRYSIVGVFFFFCLFVFGILATRENNGSTVGYMIELLKDPLASISVLTNTVFEYAGTWIRNFLGSSLASFTIDIWEPMVWLYFGTLLTSVFVSPDKENTSLPLSAKLLFLGVVAVLSTLLILAFREWSIEVYNLYDIITGTQGRYFIPIAILALLAAFNHNKYIQRPSSNKGYAIICALYLGFVIFTIVRYFI